MIPECVKNRIEQERGYSAQPYTFRVYMACVTQQTDREFTEEDIRNCVDEYWNNGITNLTEVKQLMQRFIRTFG